MRNDQSVTLLGQDGLQGLVTGCRVTDENASVVAGIFQQPAESVTLLVLRSPSGCRGNVAGFVSSSLGSQSASKAPELRQRKGFGEYKAECTGASSVWFVVDTLKRQG